jgi:hypothetical protein
MKLSNILNENVEESGETVVFNFRNSEFDMTGEMVFDVTDLIIMTEYDYAEVNNAGEMKLNITPESFAERVINESPQLVSEINDISFGGIKNFRCTKDCTKKTSLPANFDLEVTYTMNDGNQRTGTLNFRGVSFKPSREFVSRYMDLTTPNTPDNIE